MIENITVRDIMKKIPVALRPGMDMGEAIRLLLKNNVSGAVVVDEDNKLVGMLSEKDCLRIFANGAYNALPNARVSEYMSEIVKTAHPDDDLFTVAGVFLENSFRRLPVIEDDVLIGQVSRFDVLAGSRRIWETTQTKKEWTDAKYIPDELRARLDSKS